MTLVELFEPIFQYVCRVSRSARQGTSYDQAQIRSELKSMLADLRARSSQLGALASRYDECELAVIFFADFTIRSSTLSFAEEWKDLAAERHELAGDQKFFEMLDQALADRSEGAVAAIAVYYTCIGLGFTGWYTGQPEYLRRKMMDCSSRLREQIEADLNARICNDAYERVNTDDLIQPPGRSLAGIAITLITLILVLFFANLLLYHSDLAELKGILQSIGSTN
ncbi:MAG: DotU family type IV/VI secretion system protein [Tepidisphaeraceae bacterium]|jgi:type VI protein secretion system component VasF